MQRSRNALCVVAAAIALTFSFNASAQGKGGGKGHGGGGNPHAGAPGKSGKGHEKAPKPTGGNPGHGKSAIAHESHNIAKTAHNVASKVAQANNHAAKHAMLLSSAVAHAASRGHADYYRVEPSGDRYTIVNRNGMPLVDLSENEARDLGRWRVGLLDDHVKNGAPSFCRSGAGHPVWGRQWCLDKGFGLGDYQDYRWGRTTDLGNWDYNRGVYQPSLTSTILRSILGTTAYNRLALQAVELGYLEPLTGRWVSQQTGPNALFVNSGAYPVAELVDTNRDFRWDDLLVALLLNR
jgi:hypothetical protein